MRNLPVDMFHDQSMRERIKKKLPYMFWVAEKEPPRGGRVGRGVGTFDLIMAVVDGSRTGFLASIPQIIQRDTFKALGRERYIHCPRRGTSPRGVEFSSEAFRMNIEQARKEGLVIDIDWKIGGVDPYARWVELWERD